MYALTYDRAGKVSGATNTLADGTQRCFSIGSREWEEFAKLNSDLKNPAPIKIADLPAPTADEIEAASKEQAAEHLESKEPAMVAANAVQESLLALLNERLEKLGVPPIDLADVLTNAAALLKGK